MTLGKDRRTNPRVAVHWRGAVQPNDSKTVLYGYTVEISVGGVGILIEKALTVGLPCTVYLEIVSPNQIQRAQVALKAKVANVILAESHFRTGMQFIDIPDGVRTALQQVVQSRHERPSYV